MSDIGKGLSTRTNRLFDDWMAWLNGPLPRWQLAFGWLLSTIVFVAFTHMSGGPSYGDGAETFYPAWAIAHGQLACTFPTILPTSSVVTPWAAPLFPLLSAGFVLIVPVGHNLAFPSASQLGPHCEHTIAAITTWSNQIAVEPMIAFGYLGWLAIMVGVVAFLRTTDKGLMGWEPVTLVLVAASPAVFQCVQTVAHPQDMLPMG